MPPINALLSGHFGERGKASFVRGRVLMFFLFLSFDFRSFHLMGKRVQWLGTDFVGGTGLWMADVGRGGAQAGWSIL